MLSEILTALLALTKWKYFINICMGLMRFAICHESCMSYSPAAVVRCGRMVTIARTCTRLRSNGSVHSHSIIPLVEQSLNYRPTNGWAIRYSTKYLECQAKGLMGLKCCVSITLFRFIAHYFIGKFASKWMHDATCLNAYKY